MQMLKFYFENRRFFFNELAEAANDIKLERLIFIESVSGLIAVSNLVFMIELGEIRILSIFRR